jgi:NTE family protein
MSSSDDAMAGPDVPAASPVSAEASAGAPQEPRGGPEAGVALCLSGGGYRAMLFHAGALWRLNELGWLAKLARVSSVSGGSITAGALALRWGALDFENGIASNLQDQVVKPLRALSRRTIDVRAVLAGSLMPGRSVSEMVARAYRRHLFGEATLQQLPVHPRFVINATNLQTGVLWRFSRPYMADYTIGSVPDPTIGLATAVAASSAFPPVLSPLQLELDPGSFALDGRGPNYRQPFNERATLSDGGVYDNLGLETAWKRYTTILVSDGGGRMQAERSVAADWGRQAIRVNAVIDNQVRAMRKRQVVEGFLSGTRQGAYWGIRSHAADFGPPPGSLPCPPDQTADLAAVKTRLKALDEIVQQRLINWGYAICDVAMRRWAEPGAPPPGGFPYPEAGVGR